MGDAADTATVYSIPPGLPFVDALAEALLAREGGEPLALAAKLVLLPTRRSCRSLREAFLRRSGGRLISERQLAPIA